ncbi:MAG: hypothetical protein KKB82_05650 [Candidatus Omnitrophica bacterium]|nr:hypothetical protein [Candidatus Omnitrophota bacterium]MBU1925391.1 hypothetical protein [Candidatus Omnitrophota bacterium]
MNCDKLDKKVWFKVIALFLINTFLVTNLGWAATALTTAENSYLAPTTTIQHSSVSSFFQNALKNQGLDAHPAVSNIKPKKTGLETRNAYLAELNQLKVNGYIKSLTDKERTDLRYEMTQKQQAAYLDAIGQVLEKRGQKVVTPDILFEAAKIATKNDRSNLKARIGLQLGTMNPLHYGHITASLAGIIGRVQKTDKNVKVMTLLANGGTVPDKPFAASAELRNQMAREACRSAEFNEWAEVTPIRGQLVDMFQASPKMLVLAGQNEVVRRFNMDMAAFIWLFVANPNVEWVFLAGSDKVNEYGKKNEQGLLVETLSRPEAHATVVYFPRKGEEIDYAKNIKPYPWLDKLWKSGFFVESTVSSFADLAAIKIRTALVKGEEHIDGKPLSETMPVGVSNYIRKTPALLFLYNLENKNGTAGKLIINKKLKEGMNVYAECLNIIKNEYDKSDTEKEVDVATLDTLYLLLLANEIRALTKAGALKEISQIFLIYSAAPGTGKGELMDATFEKGKGKFADIIGKLILYHTRNPRVKDGKSEKDGIKYHFRTEKQLKALETQRKIVTAWVNRQLQGLAIEDFTEGDLVIEQVKNAELLNKGDVIVSIEKDGNGNILSLKVKRNEEEKNVTGVSMPLDSMYDLLEGDLIANVNGEEITLSRKIKGMAAVFKEGKPIILEGGYGWFKSLIAQNPEIVSMFIAPFKDADIKKRTVNTAWINGKFKEPRERLVAYRVAQRIIEENRGEISLVADNEQSETWRQVVMRAVEDARIAAGNAEIIESDAFIQDLNDLLKLFGKENVDVKQGSLIRALAYEVNRRIVAREGQIRYSRGKRPAFGEGETDPQFDRYNRVLEGVVQILYRNDYEKGRKFGKKVLNPWGYTDEAKKEIIDNLTNDFTRFFFESILKGIRIKLVHEGHPINAPPQGLSSDKAKTGEKVLKQVIGYSDQEIELMPIERLAELIRELVATDALKRVPDLSQIFLIYSAAPGTGKGELMDATFEKGKGKYEDMIGKLILYHTRNPRVKKGKSEKDGIKYHFRSEKQLKELAVQGKIVVAWVNRQLQGLAIDNFIEEGIVIEGVKRANQFQVNDVVLKVTPDKEGQISEVTVTRAGQEVTMGGVAIPLESRHYLIEGDIIKEVSDSKLMLDRQIKGLNSVFSEGKPVILEGGYDWFNQLVKQNPNIVTMFLAPFSDSDIQDRGINTKWINDNFKMGTGFRLKAYEAIQKLIEENQGEIGLTQKDEKGEYWRRAVKKAVEDERIARANAELIESDAFINSLNELLNLFGEEKVKEERHDTVRALAYEVSRRITAREGEKRFSRGKRPEFAEGETDKQHDRYNRVLEGVVQILKRNDYDVNRPNSYLGKIVDNPWGYTEETKKRIISNLTNDFTRFFFETIIAQVAIKINSTPLTENNTDKIKSYEQMVAQSI